MRSDLGLWLAGGLLLISVDQSQAQSAWLISCEGQIETTEPSRTRGATYTDSEGHPRFFGITTHILNKACISKHLTIDPTNIKWIKPIAPEKRDFLANAQRIHLQGEVRSSVFRGEISILDRGSVSPISPVHLPSEGRPLVQMLAQPYGIEERARSFIEADVLHLDCDPGLKPAGFILKLDSPQALSSHDLILSFFGTVQGAFQIAGSSSNRPDEGQRELGVIGGTSGDQQRSWSVDITPPGISIANEITLVCPAEGGRAKGIFSLSSIGTASGENRSTWIWKSDQWKNHGPGFWSRLSTKGINTLFVAIPLGGSPLRVLDESMLVSFLKEAKQHHFSIWAVDGDPAAIRRDQISLWKDRMRAYASFNQSSPSESQLAGIQLDIEPYLNLDYPINPEGWKKAYTDGIKELSGASLMPVEIVMPFWWANQKVDGKDLLSQIAPWVNSICVMVYRTQINSIKDLAWPTLIWGATEGRNIRIALETGSLPSEGIFYLKRSDRGRIWGLDFAGITWLLGLSKSDVNPEGPSFEIENEGVSDPTKVTLSNQLSQLELLSRDLERAFGTFPSFSGLAYHELIKHMDLDPSH